MSLNPRVLTALQMWRVIGFVFLLLEAHRLLPAMFAYPGRVWRHPDRRDGFAGGLEACEATLLFNGFAAWQFLGANVFWCHCS